MFKLIAQDLSVSYHFDNSTNKFTAVENISFEIKEGEFTVIVGPSGCGKTSILRDITESKGTRKPDTTYCL